MYKIQIKLVSLFKTHIHLNVWIKDYVKKEKTNWSALENDFIILKTGKYEEITITLAYFCILSNYNYFSLFFCIIKH